MLCTDFYSVLCVDLLGLLCRDLRRASDASTILESKWDEAPIRRVTQSVDERPIKSSGAPFSGRLAGGVSVLHSTVGSQFAGSSGSVSRPVVSQLGGNVAAPPAQIAEGEAVGRGDPK